MESYGSAVFLHSIFTDFPAVSRKIRLRLIANNMVGAIEANVTEVSRQFFFGTSQSGIIRAFELLSPRIQGHLHVGLSATNPYFSYKNIGKDYAVITLDNEFLGFEGGWLSGKFDLPSFVSQSFGGSRRAIEADANFFIRICPSPDAYGFVSL